MTDNMNENAIRQGFFRVRPSGVLLENGRILVIKQNVSARRQWSFPGGHLEYQETLENCMVREFKEETGIEVKVMGLLYVTDRITEDSHILHMTFLLDRIDKRPLALEWNHLDPHPSASSTAIREVRMIPVDELTTYGFSPTFQRLVKEIFPGRGSYQGNYHTFYGE